MRASRRANDVECVMDIGDPVAQPFVHRVLQRASAAGDGNDLCAQQAHAEHIWLLPLNVFCAHVNKAGQAKTCADGCGGNAMLASASFRDDARLAHTNSQQNLANAVVDLMRAGVVQLIALEPDLRAFASWGILADFLGQTLGIIKRRWAADIMFQQIIKLRSKSRVLLRRTIFALQIKHERHECFGDIASAELTKMATLVGLVAEGVRGAFSDCHIPAPLGRRPQSCPHP